MTVVYAVDLSRTQFWPKNLKRGNEFEREKGLPLRSVLCSTVVLTRTTRILKSEGCPRKATAEPWEMVSLRLGVPFFFN